MMKNISKLCFLGSSAYFRIINGRYSVKEGIPKINCSVVLLIDGYIVKKNLVFQNVFQNAFKPLFLSFV